MTGWLLDTDILSELRRPKPEQKVVEFIAAQTFDALYVSTVTLADLRFGIELLPEVGRRADLADWLAHKVRPMFEQRVLPVSEDILLKWRLLVEQGASLSFGVALQASTASPGVSCSWSFSKS